MEKTENSRKKKTAMRNAKMGWVGKAQDNRRKQHRGRKTDKKKRGAKSEEKKKRG